MQELCSAFSHRLLLVFAGSYFHLTLERSTDFLGNAVLFSSYSLYFYYMLAEDSLLLRLLYMILELFLAKL